MMRKILFTAFSLSLLLTPAWSWNEEGHRAVALIAEQKLSPPAKAYVLSLLEAHPYGDVQNLADSACWPDRVRSDPKYHQADWHYTNLPIFLDLPVRETVDGGQSLRALNLCTAVLKDAQTSPEEKAVALSWVAHLLGDIHQPLHAANGYSNDFPKGDRGGTRFTVKSTNLHAFWDSAGGLFGAGAERDSLPLVVDDLMTNWAPTDQAVQERSPVVWQQESHRLAGDVAYRGVHRNQPLSADYVKRAEEVSRGRLTLAGYRLAAYLERLYQSQTR